jgi:hypothetical protein
MAFFVGDLANLKISGTSLLGGGHLSDRVCTHMQTFGFVLCLEESKTNFCGYFTNKLLEQI